MDRELLAQYGIDFDVGLGHCMGDAAFYRTLLSMFLDDDCFPRAQAAFADGNAKELFSCMHELKGVSGNAALTALYNAVIPLVEALRNQDAVGEEIAPLFARAQAAYDRTVQGIRLAVA